MIRCLYPKGLLIIFNRSTHLDTYTVNIHNAYAILFFIVLLSLHWFKTCWSDVAVINCLVIYGFQIIKYLYTNVNITSAWLKKNVSWLKTVNRRLNISEHIHAFIFMQQILSNTHWYNKETKVFGFFCSTGHILFHVFQFKMIE